MSDDVDITSEREEKELKFLIAANSKELDPGVAGLCTECGDHSERLIKQDSVLRCAPCRDMVSTLKRRRHYSED